MTHRKGAVSSRNSPNFIRYTYYFLFFRATPAAIAVMSTATAPPITEEQPPLVSPVSASAVVSATVSPFVSTASVCFGSVSFSVSGCVGASVTVSSFTVVSSPPSTLVSYSLFIPRKPWVYALASSAERNIPIHMTSHSDSSPVVSAPWKSTRRKLIRSNHR